MRVEWSLTCAVGDSECIAGTAPSVTACGDGVDNDGDALIDLIDTGCKGASDGSERGPRSATTAATTTATGSSTAPA